MRDFVARFDKILQKILVNQNPLDDNLKCFFINFMPSEIGSLIRRQRVADLNVVKTLAVELEDDLIIVGKWKREVRTPSAQPSTSSNPVIQRLMNDVISLKRQAPKASNSYSKPYQDIPRKYPNQQGGNNYLPCNKDLLLKCHLLRQIHVCFI